MRIVTVTDADTHKVRTLVMVKMELAQMHSLNETVARTHKVRTLVEVNRSLCRCTVSP